MIRAMLEYAETANQIADLQEGINHTFAILNEADRLIKQASTRYNHGRARKVSFRRPSPQMGREQLLVIAIKATGEVLK